MDKMLLWPSMKLVKVIKSEKPSPNAEGSHFLLESAGEAWRRRGEALNWALTGRFDRQEEGGRVTKNNPCAQWQALSCWNDKLLQSTFQSCCDQ